jgi:hypothetical protein
MVANPSKKAEDVAKKWGIQLPGTAPPPQARTPQAPAPQTPAQSAVPGRESPAAATGKQGIPAGAQTKVINGVTYYKGPDGKAVRVQ